MKKKLLVEVTRSALFLPPSSFPTVDELQEPLDEASKAELLDHVSDDASFDDDNSAQGYR